MKVNVFQHVPFEDLGSIADWFKRKGDTINYTRFFARESLPDLQQVDFLIILGGPMSVNDEKKFSWLILEKQFIKAAIDKNIPVLGICLGAQLIANALGARVFKNSLKEIGWFPVQSKSTPDSFFRFPGEFIPFHWHGETFDLPQGAVQLARNSACEQQAFQLKQNVIGLQFHLEATIESVASLIQNCRNELIAETYIQTEQQLRVVPPAMYQAGNKLMTAILSYLIQV